LTEAKPGGGASGRVHPGLPQKGPCVVGPAVEGGIGETKKHLEKLPFNTTKREEKIFAQERKPSWGRKFYTHGGGGKNPRKTGSIQKKKGADRIRKSKEKEGVRLSEPVRKRLTAAQATPKEESHEKKTSKPEPGTKKGGSPKDL